MKRTSSPTLGSAGVATIIALALGCASAPPPTEDMEKSVATIRAAQEVGAEKVPSAALHLQLAQEQLTHAKNLLQAGGDEELLQARILLMRAKSDADLAVALARAEHDRVETEQALERVQSIQPTE